MVDNDNISFNINYFKEMNNNKIHLDEFDKKILSRSVEILQIYDNFLIEKNQNNLSHISIIKNKKINSLLNSNAIQNNAINKNNQKISLNLSKISDYSLSSI